MDTRPPIYGVMAEFNEPEELMAAALRARDAGFTRMDAYSPFPIEGLSDAVGFRRTRLPLMVLIGGFIGAISGYGLQYWTSAVDYPLNVGGRPYNSVAYFIPVTFELTILFSALTGVFGMLALNRLPMFYHPVFNVERFALASRTAFFLCIEARDPKYDREKTMEFMRTLNPTNISEVEH